MEFFELNGHKVNIPSLQVSAGDVISVPEKTAKIPMIAQAAETTAKRGCHGVARD